MLHLSEMGETLHYCLELLKGFPTQNNKRDVREFWGPIRSAKTCKRRAKTHKKSAKARKFQVLFVLRIHLHQLLVPFFLDQGPTRQSLGLYQLDYPRVAKQRCTIAQGPVSSLFSQTNIFFKTCWKSEFVPDFSRTSTYNLRSNGRTRMFHPPCSQSQPSSNSSLDSVAVFHCTSGWIPPHDQWGSD